MKKVCCYMRMSTDRQEYSIESQWHVIEDFCNRQKMKVIEKYIDEGISGGYEKLNRRVNFLRMIRDSADAEWEAVVIYDSSRFSRSFEQAVAYRAELQRNNKTVVSVTEPDVAGEGGKYLNAIRAIGNEEYLIRLSQSVRRGQKEKLERGELFCKPPYGYRKVGNSYEIIPDEAAVVQSLYDRYEMGVSSYTLTKDCAAAGIRTHRGNVFDSRQVESILTNPAMKGTMHVIANAKEYTHDNAFPAIIQPEQWERVQTIYRQFKETHKKKQRPRETGGHWLCGHVRCSTCGGAYSRTPDCRYPGVYNWKCSRRFKGSCTQATMISERKLERLFLSVVHDLSDDLKTEYAAITFEPPKNPYTVDYDAQLAKLRNQLKRCKEAYEAEIDTLQEYAENKKRITDQIASVQEQKEREATPVFNPVKAKENLSNLYALLTNDDISVLDKRKAIDEILDRIVIHPDRTISILFLSPDE